ncbi:MAG: GNAT family N-acetyltransferase [Simkaniaceae bacterium]|nr:MAG: GNAT family N-acetyltransferase [Simkaniaceae bacterium]
MKLRPLVSSDEDNLLKIFSDPIAMEFYLGTKDRAEAKEWIEKSQKNYKEHQIGFLACELKETGEFVGICGLLVQSPVNGRDEIEVGYLFVRDYWGQGLATEAARGCMDYGFKVKGYHRIISLIDPNNSRSIQVAVRNGLKKEGETLYKGKTAAVYVLDSIVNFP